VSLARIRSSDASHLRDRVPKVGPDVHRIDDAAVVFGIVVAPRFRALVSDNDYGIASVQRCGGILPELKLCVDEVGRGFSVGGPLWPLR
jgi:hypothetical protein